MCGKPVQLKLFTKVQNLSCQSTNPILIQVYPLKNRGDQLYPTLTAISPTPTLHIAWFKASSFSKPTLLLSSYWLILNFSTFSVKENKSSSLGRSAKGRGWAELRHPISSPFGELKQLQFSGLRTERSTKLEHSICLSKNFIFYMFSAIE